MVVRTRRFPGGEFAAGRARRAAREALAGALTPGQLADVELLVSELATNCVRHGGCGEDAELVIEAEIDDGRVRVNLHDEGEGFEKVVPKPPPAGRAGGYGLLLLERLSDSWGTRRNGGFCVWFELQRATPA